MKMDLINIALTCTAIANAGLGSFIFYKGGGSKISKVFAQTIFGIMVWTISMIFYRSSVPEAGLFWGIALYISASLIGSTFLYFTYVFPWEDEGIIRKRNIIYGINLLLVVLIAIPGVIIRDVEVVSSGENIIKFSDLYFLYFVYTTTFFFYGYYRLYRKYLVSNKVQKAQIFFLVAGYIIASNLAFITNLTLPWLGYYGLNWIGQIFTFFIVAFTSYAIILHRLMDIKLVARKYAVSVSSIALIVIPAIIAHQAAAVWLADSVLVPIDVLILIASLYVFPSLKSFIYRFANQYLFSSLYDPNEVITKLSDKLRSTLEVKTIYSHISASLMGAFHASKIAILVFEEKSAKYKVGCNDGFDFGRARIVGIDHDVHRFFLTKNAPITMEDLRMTAIGSNMAIHELASLGVEVVEPLNIKDRPVGLIIMGRKESGEIYNDEDFNVLNVVGTQAAIALENALLYDESKKFTAVLEKRVSDATKKLQEQNEELKKLDQLKTEFVSIASHQLRTPLTATKWALEYLSDNLASKLNKEEKESFQELMIVNGKLVQLVNELLNISRIEEGRLRVMPVPTDLVAMVRTTMKEFMPLARQKRLKVQESYDALPMIGLDASIISKAVANLLSNAIKYNRDGKKLTITIAKKGRNALLTVTDEGIGIPESEQKDIMQKFFRASNAVGSNTEGTGLGLYIARNAIELSGGKVWFESTHGVGTTFYASLPLAGSKKVEGEKGLA